MNGKRVHLYDEVRLTSLLNKNGDPIEITYVRDGQEHTVMVESTYDEEAGRYYMGFASGKYEKCNLPQTIKYSFYTMKYYADATLVSLKMLVTVILYLATRLKNEMLFPK